MTPGPGTLPLDGLAVPEAMSQPSSDPRVLLVDDDFQFKLIYFQAENTLFTGIKQWFLVEGSPFPGMFSLPRPASGIAEEGSSAVGNEVEGESPSHPIILEQTRAAHFKAFLSVLYPLGGKSMSYDEWTGALHLATRWNFNEVRKKAIDALGGLIAAEPAKGVHLGEEYFVPAWLRSGVIGIVNKVMQENLDPDKLGSAPMSFDFETIAKIFYICYQARGAQAQTGSCRCTDAWRDTYNNYYSACAECNLPIGHLPGGKPAPNTAPVEVLVDQVFEKRLKWNMAEDASGSAQLIPVAGRPQAHVDTVWNFSCVTFQVEDTLFSVLKQGFLAPGSPFAAMFAQSTSGDPILLENTTAFDFRALLGAMYPQEGSSKTLSPDEWLGVLRLAHRWQFGKLRNKAIESLQLGISEWTPDKKINLGLQFFVQNWVRAGLIDLVQDQDLAIDKLMKDPYTFDQYIVTKIYCVQSKASFEVAHIRNATCSTCADDSYVYPEWDALYLKAARKLVDSVFADELKKACHPDDEAQSGPEFLEGSSRGTKRAAESQSERSFGELVQSRFLRDNVVETSTGARKRRSIAAT